MDIKKPVIEESGSYDNFMDPNRKVVEAKSQTLASIMGEEEIVDDQEEWKQHWKDMPEFVNEENQPYKMIRVRFRTEEDYKEFSKMIDQPLSPKTKSIWHPALDRVGNSLMRWIEE